MSTSDDPRDAVYEACHAFKKNGDRGGAETLAAHLAAVMPQVDDEPPEIWDHIEAGRELAPDAMWAGVLAILERASSGDDGGKMLASVVAEVLGAFSVPAPPVALLERLQGAARRPGALRRGGPGSQAQPGRGRERHAAHRRRALLHHVDGTADRGAADSEDAWRELHECNEAAVFATGGDGAFPFTLSFDPPPGPAKCRMVFCRAVP